jgi:ketosteroid isomerase-like protein
MDAAARAAELDRREAGAMASSDTAPLAAIWSDRLVVTPPSGPPVGKPAVLELVERGLLAHREVVREVEHVIDQGTVLVSVGLERVVPGEGLPQGRRYTHVWGRESGSWRLVARHASSDSDG